MSHFDPTLLDLQARELRQRETVRLLREIGCSARQAWARLMARPAPVCAARATQAA